MAEKVMLFNILKSLKNHCKLILTITLLSIFVTWTLLTFVFSPNYQATSQLYIEQQTDGIAQASDIEKSMNQKTIESYSALVTSQDVLATAISTTGSSMTPTELFEKVLITNVSGSQVLNITVKEKNRKIAAEIANSLADATVAEAMTQLQVDNLSVIAKASVEETPSVLAENIIYILTIGGLFGIILGVLLSCIIELFNIMLRTGVLERRSKESNLQTVFK